MVENLNTTVDHPGTPFAQGTDTALDGFQRGFIPALVASNGTRVGRI